MYIVSNLIFSVQEYKPIGAAHNRKAQPFVAAANIDDKRQVVSTSYNTPIGLYSSGNIQDAMEGQMRGLVHPKPERWWLQLFVSLQRLCDAFSFLSITDK